jgi:molybdate transport system ATP-binding protein
LAEAPNAALPNPLRRAADSVSLSVRMWHRIGTLAIDVDFALDKPWTILFGPSGSGKTTILRAIAGLLRPDEGRIVRPTTVFMESSERIFVPPYTRGIPLAPQAASLFPHKTVFGNVAFGIAAARRVRGSEMDATLSLFRVAHLTEKMPSELSGGEAQRVNLARAAAATMEGGLLLLDEPFTGLDVGLRSELMLDLKDWAAKRNLCVLSVTHDVAETFELSAEVIKLAEGRVVEQGPVEVVLAEERKRLLEQLRG